MGNFFPHQSKEYEQSGGMGEKNNLIGPVVKNSLLHNKLSPVIIDRVRERLPRAADLLIVF